MDGQTRKDRGESLNATGSPIDIDFHPPAVDVKGCDDDDDELN